MRKARRRWWSRARPDPRAVGDHADDVVAALAAAVRLDDRRFADGLRSGRPVAPRESRMPTTSVLALALAAGQAATLTLRLDTVSILLGVAALALRGADGRYVAGVAWNRSWATR